MKKYILGVALIIVFVVVAVQAQTSLFVRFVGSDTVYKAYHSAQEFFDDGGDFKNIQVMEQELGSVTGGNEYYATTTADTTAGTFRILKTGPSTVLGSVIVASSSGSTFTLWNATSTTDVSSTTIVKFKASVGEGTYTFDSSAPRGLIMAPPTGFNGLYVITWR